MMKQLFGKIPAGTVLVLAFWTTFVLAAQDIPVNQYGLPVVSDRALYSELVAQDSSKILVNLKTYIPDIRLDIRYATADNFMGKPLYPSATAYLRKPAARALKAVQDDLRSRGLGLLIFDAYRPYSITLKMWEPYKDPDYVASPKTGSRHNRGCAVDLSLIDLKIGQPLPMPTPYDDFTEKAHHDYDDLSENVLRNRALLQLVMIKHGFLPLSTEWWHYDFQDWKKYEVLDIPFSDLGK